MSHVSTNLQVHSVTSPMSDDLTSTPLRGDGLRLRGFPRGGNVIGARDNLICDKEPALGGSLHRVEIILVGVAAGEEEVVDGGGLRGPQPVLPWDLAVESLAELDHRAPSHLGVKGGGVGGGGVGVGRVSGQEGWVGVMVGVVGGVVGVGVGVG